MEKRVFEIAKSDEDGAALIVFEFWEHDSGYRVGLSLYPENSNISIVSWGPCGGDIREREASFDYAKQRARELYGVELGPEITAAPDAP